MASDFQSSFIPKEPVTEEVFKKKKAGILGVIAVSIFISSLVVYAAMFAYKRIIQSDIKNLQAQLAQSEKNIDKKTIEDMSKFSKKLDLVRTIVSKHQIVSAFLESLASSTVSQVQFSQFNYTSMDNGTLTVTMTGKAASYASVALQEDMFTKNPYFTSVSFSNLTLAEKGLVSFDVSISVDPKIVVYSPPVPVTPATAKLSTTTAKSDQSVDDITADLDTTGLDGLQNDLNNL